MAEIEFKEYKFWKNKEEQPESLVIMLHGLGADGEDLIGLAHYFAKELPNTAFVAPNAPYPNDMAPPGQPMGYQWFSLRDLSPTKLSSEISNIMPLVNAYIDAKAEEFKLPFEKIALLGFSQGSMLSLYLAPRKKEKLAGVLSYSGALVGAEELEQRQDLHRLPVHFVHGTADDVVPFAGHEPAKALLTQLGHPTTSTECEGVGHGVDEKGIEEGINFLKKYL